MDSLKESYDWMVLGDHPAALLSGCLAARRGLSVLILPLGEIQAAHISKSGQVVDPESGFVPGIGKSEKNKGFIGVVLEKMGVDLFSSSHIDLNETPIAQILTPESRVQLGREYSHWPYEVEREWGTAIMAKLGIASAVKKLEKPTTDVWRTYAESLTLDPPGRSAFLNMLLAGPVPEKILATITKSVAREKSDTRIWFDSKKGTRSWGRRLGEQGLDEFFEGLWFSLTSHDRKDPRCLALSHALAMAQMGGCFRGGITAYRKFLTQLAAKLGAHLLNDKASDQSNDDQCRRIFVDDGKFRGIQLARKGKVIVGRAAVLGCSLDQIKPYLSRSAKKERWTLKRAPIPDGWTFTLSMTVHEEAIPPGMQTRAVWKEQDAPSLEIEIAEPKDYGLSQKGLKLLFVRTVVPYHQKTLLPEYQKTVAARIFRKISEIFPFLEYHIVRVFPDFREKIESTPGSTEGVQGQFREAYGFSLPELIPENLRSVQAKGVGCESGYRDLYVASGESYPELGKLGAYAAGFEALGKFVGVKAIRELRSPQRTSEKVSK